MSTYDLCFVSKKAITNFHLKIVNFYSFIGCCILNRFVKVMPILGIFFSGGIIGVVLGCLALLLSVFAVTIVLFRSRFEGFFYCLIVSVVSTTKTLNKCLFYVNNCVKLFNGYIFKAI